MPNKSRPLMGKRNSSPDVIDDVCPHQHFKSEVIDRNFLSRKQHLNLLCTPKGYRWMIKKEDRRIPDPCKLSKKKPGKTYVHNILAEMWDLLTPEMVQRMKEMLMSEFGLSEEAALDFICRSRYDTSLTAQPISKGNTQDENVGRKDDRPPEGSSIPCLAAAEKLCKNDLNIDIDPSHIKEFSKAISAKLSKYVTSMMCTKRDAKHRIVAETILRGLCDLTGEETTLDNPKNRLHKVLTVTSDRLALWLARNMEDEETRRANKRRREDEALKKKALAKQRQKRKREEELDKINKEKDKNEKRRAEEEAEKKKLADEEKERKKAEKERRHQEMEKFREEERQKRKEEMKKAKEQSGAAKNTGDQGGSDRSKRTGIKTGFNYKAKNEQSKTYGVKSGSKGQLASKTGVPRSNQARNTFKKSVKITVSTGARASEAFGGTKETDPRSPIPASESPAKVQSISEKGGTTESQGRDTEGDQNELKEEISKASHLSTVSRAAMWGDDRVKTVASAFSISGKTPLSSQSSSIDKLIGILSSQGKAASRTPTQGKTSPSGAVSSQERLAPLHSSSGILAKIITSQGKLISEHTAHSKLGTISTSEDKLATEFKKRKESIITVKKTVSEKFEVHRNSYAEAKHKIEAVKKQSTSHFAPPTVPFDPKDPKSLAQWLQYATQMTEEWGRWIDKTIQDTEDKAISYLAKEKEGKTEQQDVEDWNRFVQKTNEDAKRWRRQRKSMLYSAKDRRHE